MDSSHEFVAEYRDLLAQLKRNEKRDINVLSMLAEDNRQHAAAIVGAIEQHIAVVRAGPSNRRRACARVLLNARPLPRPGRPSRNAHTHTGTPR